MFVWFGTKTKVRRVAGGRVERRPCPECGETANFVECEATESVSVFSVVDLTESTETLFRCSACGELFRLDDDSGAVAEPEETEAERQRRRMERLLEEAEQAKQRREMERAVAEAKAEVQLEELKAKMGLAPAPSSSPEPAEPARRRRWPWRRRRDDE